jgi:hypothetical protein
MVDKRSKVMTAETIIEHTKPDKTLELCAILLDPITSSYDERIPKLAREIQAALKGKS